MVLENACARTATRLEPPLALPAWHRDDQPRQKDRMAWLRWDETHHTFRGRRLCVTAHAFQAAVDSAVATGVPEPAAILALLEERAWSAGDAGVTMLPTAADALAAVEQLLRRAHQRQRCD